jgi:hypothetical protein
MMLSDAEVGVSVFNRNKFIIILNKACSPLQDECYLTFETFSIISCEAL